jgi:4'-phosphopantetheinyl transferase
MMELRWLQQTSADVPQHDDWLCPAERQRLSRLLIPKRRADWRLGRWTVKNAIASYLDLPRGTGTFSSIEVIPAQSGAPRVFIRNRAASVAISLSHCDGIGLCAVARNPVLLGCDVERVEPRSSVFVRDYFTQSEQEDIATHSDDETRAAVITLIWSAKEAALKALEVGLRADTRSVIVSLEGYVTREGSWRSSTARVANRCFRNWWKQENQLVYCFASSPYLDSPRALDPVELAR